MTRLPKPLAYVAVILFVCLYASHISAQEIRLKDSEHIQAKEWEHLFTYLNIPGFHGILTLRQRIASLLK